jgi:cyclic pyranopterin phosphate synthase
MPEDPNFMHNSKLMTANEITKLAKLFVDTYGIKKVRLTGGEPLARADLSNILSELSKLDIELSLTTNGILLDKYFESIISAGIKSINISLDTLKSDRFKMLTRRDTFERVWKNIIKATESFIYIKLNVVAMKGINDDELLDFVRLSRQLPIHIRFIEFMPFSGNKWERAKVITQNEILDIIASEESFEKVKDSKHSTARAYKLNNSKGTFAIISTISNGFCSNCNRIRLTADGKIRNCLFDRGEIDLLRPLRNGEDVCSKIEESIKNKKAQFGGLPNFEKEAQLRAELDKRSMLKIGG